MHLILSRFSNEKTGDFNRGILRWVDLIFVAGGGGRIDSEWWPDNFGTGGRIKSEWVAEFSRNTHVKELEPRLSRRSFLVRFADDFIIGCELESDARKVLELLEERMKSFSLSLHPDKTNLLPFGKPAGSVEVDKRNGTFNFLGFTFHWSKTRQGYWVVKKKTMKQRLNRFIKGIWGWCRDNRHAPLKDQYFDLNQKLRGYYYQYYGVRGNYKVLEVVYESTEKAWRFWLTRRSRKGGISWSKFEKIRRSFPFPKPRIIHNI